MQIKEKKVEKIQKIRFEVKIIPKNLKALLNSTLRLKIYELILNTK